MALTYRSPLEEVVCAFEPAVQTAIASTAANHYKNLENENFSLFRYALSADAKRRLVEAGIYVSPYAAVPHSHPVCKTLENYMLYVVLPNLIDNRFSFVGIKNSKLDLLKSRHDKLDLVKSINRYVSSKDKARYGSDLVVRSSKPHAKLSRGCFNIDTPTLRDLVPETMSRGSRHLVLHDEIHYWSVRDLCSFLDVLKPEVMYATMVYPPELLAGAKESLNPWCYKFVVDRGKFRFSPDGVVTESYEQTIDNGFLLKAKGIRLDDSSYYSVDIICSKFAHHLVCISRGELLSESSRVFGPFDATVARGIGKISSGIKDCYPVKYGTVSRVYRYLRSLKKPDEQSAMAKLSQIEAEPTGHEIKFFQEFSHLVIGTNCIRTHINAQLLDEFIGKLWCRLPPGLAKLFRRAKEVALDEFIESLEPYTVSVKLEVIDPRSRLEIALGDSSSMESEEDIIDFNERLIYGASLSYADRVSAPYSKLEPLTTVRVHLLMINAKAVIALLASKLARELLVNDHLATEAQLRVKLTAIMPQLGLLGQALVAQFLRRKANFESLLRQIRAIQARWRRLHHDELGADWFASLIRGNRKFLTHIEEAQSFGPVFNSKYKVVINDILVLAKRRGEMRNHEGGEANAEMESGFDYDNSRADAEHVPSVHTCDVSVEPNSYNMNMEVSTFDCSCGVSMPILARPFLVEQCFEFPDVLRGRMAGWYSKEEVTYEYNGGKHTSLGWPEWLTLWMEVNSIDTAYYDCCLAQVYEEGSGIGFHSDDEPIFEPNSKILTANISGGCRFRVRCLSGHGETQLVDSRLFEMGEGFQTSHKHSVTDCTKGRVSVTFRVLRKKVAPKSAGLTTPKAPSTLQAPEIATLETTEGVGSILPKLSSEGDASAEEIDSDGCVARNEFSRKLGPVVVESFECSAGPYITTKIQADGNCFWRSMEEVLGLKWQEIKRLSGMVDMLCEVKQGRLHEQMGVDVFAEDEGMAAAACVCNARIEIYSADTGVMTQFTPESFNACVELELVNEHLQPRLPLNACVIYAIAKALGRRNGEVWGVIRARCDAGLIAEFEDGEGISKFSLDMVFRIFDLEGHIFENGDEWVANAGGRVPHSFLLENGHLSAIKRKTNPAVEMLKHSKVNRGVSDTAHKLMENIGTMMVYKVSRKRAEILSESLLNGSTGVLSSSLFNGAEDLTNHFHLGDNSERKVKVVLGTFGAGKSTLFSKFMRANVGRCVTYVSPRKVLAEAFKKSIKLVGRGRRKVGTENWAVQTFEIFALNCWKVEEWQAVIIDEVQLYPPGYLDLILSIIPTTTFVYLTGDPCQSDYDSEKDRFLLQSMGSDIENLLHNSVYKYAVRSRRMKNPMFLDRLPCMLDFSKSGVQAEPYLIIDNVEAVKLLDKKWCEVFLVSSFDEKRIVQSHFGLQTKCLTFGESTGLTFHQGIIVLTQTTQHTSEKRWLTALSRFSLNICFLNLTGQSPETLLMIYQGKVFAQFLSGRSGLDVLTKMLPGEPKFVDTFMDNVGRDEGVREDKLQGDPWLKTMIDLMQDVDIQEVEMMSELLEEECFKTHLPQDELESVRARWVHKILCKEFREKRLGSLVSEQFTDEHSKQVGAKQLTNAAERFETIYPRHRANDKVTFVMAVKKRLRFSSPAKESAKLREAENYGHFLLNEFIKKVPLKRKHDPEMMKQSKWDFESKKVSKSAATIENHSNRSCRDWLIDIGLIFSKSQLCTKFDNRFRDAKAAQTIVCFQHSVLCRFAPYMRYIEKKMHEVLPEKYYIHSGKGLEDLNDWVIKNNFSGICTESDYEAFDASQDQYIVAFELALMRYLGLPNDLIEDYKFIKTHLGSKLGNFAIMRFSGEASTFLFNTMANMLFTFMRYEIKGNEAICFAGDDMCASKRLNVSTKFADFLGKLKLKAKVQFTSKPTFCGWHLCPDGIYKKPQLVLERMCIAKELNNLHNCIDNYAIEVAFAYRLGERSVNRMDEEELQAYYNCVRVIIKWKHHMKSDIRKLYENAVDEC